MCESYRFANNSIQELVQKKCLLCSLRNSNYNYNEIYTCPLESWILFFAQSLHYKRTFSTLA